MNNNINISPTYTEILKQIGQQLKDRKSSLLKRTLLITWPFIVLFIALYAFTQIYDFNTLTSIQKIWLVGTGALLFVCATLYSSIIRFIFEIEKQIWVDSYFDKKNLTLSQSWNIAKKLFWPGFKFRLKIAFRYYFLPLAIIVAIVYSLASIAATIFNNNEGYATITIAVFIIFIILLIGMFIYGYYIRTKLRYTWFLFLDSYGNTYSYTGLISEMNKLNNISKSETFKKSLIANIGTDSVNGLTQFTVNTIGNALAQFGGAGKLLGAITQVYGNEASRQATSLGNIAAQYILYRFARKELYGEEQHVNENLYAV